MRELSVASEEDEDEVVEVKQKVSIKLILVVKLHNN